MILIDYRRPTATKDDHGGWNGPYPVVRNEPERGQVICRVGGREVAVGYPDARYTLFAEVLLAFGDLGDAMRILPGTSLSYLQAFSLKLLGMPFQGVATT